MEELAKSRGQEFMRSLMQDHLDLRAEREKATVVPMRGVDGVERTEVRPSSRPLGTLFGTVAVHRLALVKHGASGGLRPLDAHLNLPAGLYSHGVQREIAWGVAQSAYDVVIANLRRTSGATIAKHQAEALVVKIAADFQEFYLDLPRQVECREDLLVLTFDGSGVVIRPEGLRPETRKKAKKSGRNVSVAESSAAGGNGMTSGRIAGGWPRSRRCTRSRRCHGRRRTSWTSCTEPDRNRSARRRRTSGWASLERSILDVVDEAFCEAMQRDPAGERRWVAVVDGNAEQLAAIRSIGRPGRR